MEDKVIDISQGSGDDFNWYARVQRSIEIGYKCENCGEQNIITVNLVKTGRAEPQYLFDSHFPKGTSLRERRAEATKMRNDTAVAASTALLNAAERDMRNDLEDALLKHRVSFETICKNCKAPQSWVKRLNKAIDIKEESACFGCIAKFIVYLLVVPGAILILSSLGSGNFYFGFILGGGLGLLAASLIVKLISKLSAKISANIDYKTLDSNSRINDPECRPYLVTKDDNTET